MPDAAVKVESLPMTATGKIYKRALREEFKGHYLQSQLTEGSVAPISLKTQLGRS